jgi:hypothetical protein
MPRFRWMLTTGLVISLGLLGWLGVMEGECP